jgi:hypothetical protein
MRSWMTTKLLSHEGGRAAETKRIHREARPVRRIKRSRHFPSGMKRNHSQSVHDAHNRLGSGARPAAPAGVALAAKLAASQAKPHDRIADDLASATPHHTTPHHTTPHHTTPHHTTPHHTTPHHTTLRRLAIARKRATSLHLPAMPFNSCGAGSGGTLERRQNGS